MKIITRLYILQVILIGAIVAILMVLKISSDKKLNLFLKSSHANNESMVHNILKIDRDIFMRPLRDNSEWDNTIEYIKNPTRSFEEECLNTLLPTFSFNHIMVFNQNGERVYYINDSDSVNLDIIFRADQIKQLLTPATPFCNFFLIINNELVEISGATIVSTFDTSHASPAKGYLFFARNWNTPVIRRLEEITGATIEVRKTNIENKQSDEEGCFRITHNLTDLQNRTVASLIFTFPGSYFREWESDTLVLTIISIFIGLFVILVIGFLSLKWLVNPLKAIITSLNTGETQHIDKLKDTKNEFGEIAHLIDESIFTKRALEWELKNKIEGEKALTCLKNKAEESDRLKTAFLSNMSHEIRTPMNCILGFIQLLEQEDYTPEERFQYMSFVSSSGKKLLNIINDILDFSRIESGQMILQPIHFDLNRLLDNLLISITNEKNRIAKHDLVIELEKGADQQCHVYCDINRLEQILNNLLSNALKFTFSGKITFGYSCEEQHIIFYVQDTGVGISIQNQEIVFERFRQEEETHSKTFGGTGLGLPISKGMVELMGGKMWLTSEKGKGSTFYFSLPDVIRHEPIEKEKTTASPIQSLNLSGKTLLVAEDVRENIELICTMLKSTHVNILCAENGLIAVNLCQENPSIDLVLMDIQMPVMNGHDATREIKKMRPDLPVIALTAYAFDKDRLRCEEAGCNDFLPKPINRSDLLQKLGAFLCT